MLPPIGSLSSLAGQGQGGVVISRQPIGEAHDGRQLIALKIEQTVDVRSASGETGSADPSKAGVAPPLPARSETWPTAARLPSELNASEKSDVKHLQQRDQQVRQEEKAHAAVAGDLAGPINYVYQLGPDGRQYAVGGSVGIQASTPSGDPADAARKAGRVAAAANAATNPSAQDYAAARQAYALGSQLSEPRPTDQREDGLNLLF